MLYHAYQTKLDLLQPVLALARLAGAALGPWNGAAELPPRALSGAVSIPLRHMVAALELVSRVGLTHHRPSYGIDRVTCGTREAAVTEVPIHVTPFGTLLQFRKDVDLAQPRVLVVAPLSGHFATLLRGTIRTLLADHDVYVTDWHNARDVPLDAGRFGFDDYIAHVIRFLEVMGPGAHVLAVCQPCVQVLAAAALMAEDDNPAQPLSMTLMAGPVDTRINPTKVNELATSKPIDWFERTLIARVPWRHAGAGRRVYPGFVQLIAFMSMNITRHDKAHRDLYDHLVKGETEQAQAIRDFYDEYFAVLDLPAEFYLETVRWVFQEARLAKGELTWRDRRVDPRAIRRTALLTVEGERDDICALGQTSAAQDLCSGLRPYLKRHHMQVGVGHYGVFSGRRWENHIYPIVRNLMLSAE
ncbi:polyhydroxyalkanoate depolymerase [Azospirillum sp. RWY-5-1]|uniref:Polyhydroxyalkanoate depolymerase n=1 Tax=Azospirillum oleiclasticum TaxID=2735135 RepID=A0ABX2TLX7_9PROT|nr:polyhydroxyalkanoate depolymerase [Azospirillum oleiclasticum]NYZ17751.1 polyhydroxyalkanoate depolymerase [Azospirillum oleiclasticum]NYZ24203.1 polyhydroxyalkanoate depolymerase [Azospirillum oleiclasticum]